MGCGYLLRANLTFYCNTNTVLLLDCCDNLMTSECPFISVPDHCHVLLVRFKGQRDTCPTRLLYTDTMVTDLFLSVLRSEPCSLSMTQIIQANVSMYV